MKASDLRIVDLSFGFEDFLYRSPIKFGGVALDKATILNVSLTAETRAGVRAKGFGSMPLGNVWSFPTKNLTYDQTLSAMKRLAELLADNYRNHGEPGHPIDIAWSLEHDFASLGAQVDGELGLVDKTPLLCTMVVASPFDAALHDAFGKAHGLNCFSTYGPDFMNHDLGYFLGDEFRGDRLDTYVRKTAQPRMPLYHLVGAVDPLDASELVKPVGDGLPETLEEWIPRDGLTHLKIKLNGENLDWDVGRVVSVDRVANRAQAKRGVSQWFYSLDFNEKCENVDYLLAFLEMVKAQAPAGFDRVQYIEQPTARDLKANRQNVMHKASALRPVVIDESLIDLESLLTAREMGYTGAALKACKGQSQSLLMAAAAQKFGMFLCVQDLTCPGASLLHSASLASHVPGVAAIESNARQYCPAANAPWADRFPGIFKVCDGYFQTSCLDGLGLGAV